MNSKISFIAAAPACAVFTPGVNTMSRMSGWPISSSARSTERAVSPADWREGLTPSLSNQDDGVFRVPVSAGLLAPWM